MSSDIQAQLPEAHARRRVAARVFKVVSILALIFTMGWLAYQVYQLNDRLAELESDVHTLESRAQATDTRVTRLNSQLSSVQSELGVVGSLARNANMYAHTHYSDVRLKRNIDPLDDSLRRILQLRGVYFEWNPDSLAGANLGSGRQIGLIAQEVERVFPELVSEDADGLRSVDYSLLGPILVEAVKEQQAILDAQHELIAGLGQETSDLDMRLLTVEDTLRE